MAAIQYLSLLFLLYSSVDGHSWPENPRPRQYRWAIEGGCVEDETGKVVRRCTVDNTPFSARVLHVRIHTHAHTHTRFYVPLLLRVQYPICGKDANGLDIKNLRPASYLQPPCTFARTIPTSSTSTSPPNPTHNQNRQNN